MGRIRWPLLGLAIVVLVVSPISVVGLIFAGLLGSGLADQKLTAVGTYIYGVATVVLALATVVLALAAVVGGGFALLQWRTQLELRRRQADLRHRGDAA